MTVADSTATRVEAEPFVDDGVLALFVGCLDGWMRENVDSQLIDALKTIPRPLLTGLAELGAFGVSIPEQYDGSGLGLPGACAVVECLAKYDRSVATTVGLHLGLGTRPLVDFGTSQQKEHWLPKLASGQHIAAFATTEPSAGSDLSHLATTVRNGANGTIILDGQKIFVTNGGIADVYTLTTSSGALGGGARGQSVVIATPTDKGVRRGAEEDKLGLRGSSTTSMYFDEVALPADRIVGEVGQGHTVLAHALSWGRTIMASGCLGTARAALAAARRHTADRRQFGRTLDQLPVVRTQLADMIADVEAMSALVRRTAHTSPGTSEFERRSLSSKVFCSETDWLVCDTAHRQRQGA